MQLRVECGIGDKGPREPHFAVIDSFEEDGLSSKVVLEMVSGLAEKKTKRIE